METEMRVAHHNLSVLQLAEVLGNVSEACRQRGVSPDAGLRIQAALSDARMEGLKDLPPIPKSSPLTTPTEHPVCRPQPNAFSESVGALQVDLNTWLVHYNNKKCPRRDSNIIPCKGTPNLLNKKCPRRDSNIIPFRGPPTY